MDTLRRTAARSPGWRAISLAGCRLLDQLEAAVQASLLRESTEVLGRFSFEHALINHTLYQGLGATRRARIHHRVAEALEQLHGTDSEEQLAELALHWRLATVSVDKTKAAGYSIRAGQKALQSLAPSEAAKLFADALELLGPEATVERCEALIGLGEAQRQTGLPAHRETLLEASGVASDLNDADLAARAALTNNRRWVSGVGAVDVERVAAIQRARELDDPPQPARHARLLALLAMELSFEPDHARRWALADEAVALARRAGDACTLAAVLNHAWHATWAPDTLSRRDAYARELIALVAGLQDLNLEFTAMSVEANTAVELGDFARAEVAFMRKRAIAEQTRQPTHRWVVGWETAAMACMRGELEAGERLAEQALQVGMESGEPDAVSAYGATLLETRIAQGRGAEVIPLLEQKVASDPGVPAWEAALSRLYCFSERRAAGAEVLARAAVTRFENLRHDFARLCGLALYADAAAETGSVEAAATLYALIEPYADQVVWIGAAGYGHARMYLGLLAATLGRHEQADAHFAFACVFHRQHGLRVWEARSELGWAAALAERGENDRAREHASRALEFSREHGYGAFEPRAAAVLEATSAVS
jgi:hypothetical protein